MRNKYNGEYLPCKAHLLYKKRLHKQDGLKIEKDPILKNYIADKMVHQHYSPDAISSRLKLDSKLPNVSTETIYNRVERPITKPPSHTTVQAMSHTAVSDLCLTKDVYMENKLFLSKYFQLRA